jgi:chromosome segregation ATPase
MAQGDMINRIVDRVNDFNRRVRDLEEKIRNLNARVNTLDDTILDKTEDLQNEIHDLQDDMSELRDRVANMEVDINEINQEKRKFVTSQELEEIENYMDLMNPLQAGFITRSEAEKMIENNGSGVSEDEIEDIVDRKIKNLQEKKSTEETGDILE